jgi:hypothetical protein
MLLEMDGLEFCLIAFIRISFATYYHDSDEVGMTEKALKVTLSFYTQKNIFENLSAADTLYL